MKSLHNFTLADLKARARKAKGCWLWTGNRHEAGYPRAFSHGHAYFAHILAYRLVKGPIPRGLKLWHRCGHSHCINPAHLRPMTQKQIVGQMLRLGRFAVGSRLPGAKLTESDVRRIRRLHATGKWSFPELGRKFGVDATNILMIVHRKRWKHVK